MSKNKGMIQIEIESPVRQQMAKDQIFNAIVKAGKDFKLNYYECYGILNSIILELNEETKEPRK